ncbi:hypothetical protein D3C81_919990 [compost metagenome]
MGDLAAPGLAHQVADVDAGQVVHGEHAHGQAQAGEHLIHLGWRGAFKHQAVGFAGIGFEHAVADEAEAHAGNHRRLADPASQFESGGQHVRRGLAGIDHFQQAHDVGWTEEVQADDVLGPAGHAGDLVDIQRRGVGGEDGARLAHPVEGAEHLLLDFQFLEDRLDHQVGVGQVGVIEGAGEQVHALANLLGAQLAALQAARVVLVDPFQPAIQGIALAFQDGHRDAGVEEVHGDAAAHGAGADHRDLPDRAQLGGGVDTRHLAGLALGDEYMTQGGRLKRFLGLPEQRLLASQAILERQHAGGFHRGKDQTWNLATFPARFVLGAVVEEKFVGQLFGRVWIALFRAGRRAGAEQFVGIGAGVVQQAFRAFRDSIENADQTGAVGVQLVAGKHDVECRLGADQARQALGAAGAR